MIDIMELGGGYVRDPYPYYAEMGGRAPVVKVRLPDGSETWYVLGHAAARAALNDARLVKDWRKAPLDPAPAHGSLLGPNLLEVDPPEHTRLRKLVARAFTQRRVAALEPRVQQITDELLDDMLGEPGRRADLVDALAFPLPITVICELLGVPFLDREAFRAWSNDILDAQGPEAEELAAAELRAYLLGLIATKREQPGDDLLSELIRTHDEDGARLSPDELVGMAFLLLVAGHETTVNLLSNATLALLQHPDELAALRADPALLDGAVEETLRYDSPVERATVRYAREPVAFGGAVIPAGDSVIVVLGSAGRDPERWPDPDRFDIRRPVRSHLSFGHGPHFCIGAPLARLEARVALGALLRRCPGLALDVPPQQLRWRLSHVVRGPESLPVRW
ncbi:cytochrome P450 [Streptomyces sp. ACA25]|uniref:cytochrome P450 family protein n=1 Tax=Streptomyces sp. ACA25 TaxID=3022596 RepID=UPI002306F072|nr:cytochrome P450 [Streptomyces sp. ACA25]MDB1089230.1 cytochrome P450 [Streptomyces sp. ACA25]